MRLLPNMNAFNERIEFLSEYLKKKLKMGPFMNWNRHEALAKWRWTQLYICMGRFTN